MKQASQLIELLTPGAPAVRTAIENQAVHRGPIRWETLLDPLSLILTRENTASADLTDNSSPLIVYPGLARDSLSMRPVMRLCRRMGYDARDWGRGVNLGPTDSIEAYISGLARDVARTAQETGKLVTLVGWSLGGVYAREIARLIPEAVRHVVAIGSPDHYQGDAFGVRWLLRWAARTGREDVLNLLALLRRPLRTPLTCISALADGSIARLPALA
jgi:pimeloyl-ACP methyl ester carboxylesterase